MSRHRFFLAGELPPAPVGSTVEVPFSGADLHHAVSVLRVRAGEEIDVVSPSGRVSRVTVTHAGPDGVFGTAVDVVHDASAPSRPEVTLFFGVSKGSRNDDVIEGAVEVGVGELVPIITARSVVKLDAEKRAERGERWRRIAHAAAKQSKRASIPHVADPAPLTDAVSQLAGYGLVLVAWEDADAGAPGIARAIEANGPLPQESRVALVIGPEGGLDAEEIAALERAGGVVVTLGETILRVETAGVVAGALVIHELGGLGNDRE